MIDVDEGITLETEEYFTLCHHFRINQRRIFDPPIYPAVYAIVREWGTDDVLGYLWWNDQIDKWVWFTPDLATEEVVELFG